MISSIGKHYLYRHIRLDTREPFYIGIGTKRNCKNFKPMYERAFEVKQRSSFWKNITAKTHYEVEILLESDDYEFIKQKEVEFIALYGRKDCCDGVLVNLTDGGDGILGNKHTEETKQKMLRTKAHKKEIIISSITKEVISLYSKGVIITEIAKMVKSNKGNVRIILEEEGMLKNSSDYKKSNFYIYRFDEMQIVHYNLNYNNLSKILSLSEGCIRNHVRTNKPIIDVNYLILDRVIDILEARDIYDNRVLNKGKLKRENFKYQESKKIIQKDLEGKEIKIWNRMQDIIDAFNLKNSTPILRVIKGQRKTFKNHLKAVRFVYENFCGTNRDKIIDKLYSQSIVKVAYNPGSEHNVILVVDKYGLLN